jgi:hypothetical protein
MDDYTDDERSFPRGLVNAILPALALWLAMGVTVYWLISPAVSP